MSSEPKDSQQPDTYSIFPELPSGFNLKDASSDELDYYGIPQRPDAERDPKLFEFWLKLISPRFNAVPPVFIDPPMAPKQSDASAFGHVVPMQNWSGAVINPPWPNRFVSVFGRWIVPEVADPAQQPLGAEPGGARSVVWVGLDGFNAHLPKASMPQIGTAQWLQPTSYFAWWEWWRNTPRSKKRPRSNGLTRFDEDDFKISIGDEILAGLQVHVIGDVMFFIKNQSTGEYRSFMAKRHALGDIEPLGASAEWIVERPINPDTMKLCALPDYGSVTFDYCLAQAGAKPLARLERSGWSTGTRSMRG